MKRLSGLISALAVVATLLIGAAMGTAVAKSAPLARAQSGTIDGVIGVDEKALQNNMGLTFSPVDLTTQAAPKIAKDDATARAKVAMPPSETTSAGSRTLALWAVHREG